MDKDSRYYKITFISLISISSFWFMSKYAINFSKKKRNKKDPKHQIIIRTSNYYQIKDVNKD